MKSVGLVLFSSVFFGTYGIWSKLMLHGFGEFSQAWTRGFLLAGILISFGIVKRKFTKVKRQDLKWYFIITACGALNQAPYFYGFSHLSIGTATLLFYLMLTLGTYGLGAVFFQEKLTWIKYLSLFLAIIGLSIIYKFSLTSRQILPAIATMLAGMMGASGVVFSKKLSSEYSETQILSSIFLLMGLSNLLLGFSVGEKLPSFTTPTAWLAQAGYAAAMLLANATVIAGYKQLEPSIGGLIGLLEVVFAAVFGILFFREILTLQLILGSIFILSAAALPEIYTVYRKNIG